MKIIKLALFYLKILFVGVITGSLLMILVFSLPTSIMKKNACESLPMLKREGNYYYILNEYEYKSRLDGFTDNLMINNAIFDNPQKSIIEKFLGVYSYQYPAELFQEEIDRTHLVAYLEGKDNYSEVPYYRYWHGYLILLKPLLSVFNYGDIRSLNFVMQILLVFFISNKMFNKQKYKIYIPAFLVTYFSMTPLTLFMSLQFSFVTYIALISSLYILYKKKINYIRLFYIIGIITSYIDLLTFPLITLGIPLIFAIIKSNKSPMKSGALKAICLFIINWGAGYFLMWASKWIIGSLILKSNLLEDAFQQFLFRSSHSAWGSSIKYFDLISINISVFKGSFVWIFSYVFIFYTFKIVKLFRLKTFSILFDQLYLFLPISLLPIIWIVFTTNHSYIHFWYVHRIFSIDVFAVLTWLPFTLQRYKTIEELRNSAALKKSQK